MQESQSFTQDVNLYLSKGVLGNNDGSSVSNDCQTDNNGGWLCDGDNMTFLGD